MEQHVQIVDIAGNAIKSPRNAVAYACLVAKKRCPELEEIIATDAYCAYMYARDVVTCRWPEAEETISQDAEWACWYARDVICGRWPEAEETIAKNTDCAFHYAIEIIQGRWPEVEEVIAKSKYCATYLGALFTNQEVITKDEVTEFLWLRSGVLGYFASKELFERPVSLLDIGVTL